MLPKPEISPTTKLAILIPTVRWNDSTRGLIASTIGTANEEIAVLIGDNSENAEKQEFLRKISGINKNIISVSHKKNIGATDNLCFLLDWCKDIEFVAVTGDDDWMTSCYYPNALDVLKKNPSASCCEAGTSFVDFGDGIPLEISQPSMIGTSMLERLTKWSAIVARVTMYSASRRNSIQAAVDFQKKTPLHGLTMAENLWELNRLAVGDFIREPANSCFVHYPAHGSNQGNPKQRFYNLLCKDAGLSYSALDFMDLCSAIQCALFLMGNLSPLSDPEEKFFCGQKVFRHIYTEQFIKKFQDSEHKRRTSENITELRLRNRLLEHITPPFSESPILTEEVLSLFIELMGYFQEENHTSNLAQRLRDFFDELKPSLTNDRSPEKFVLPLSFDQQKAKQIGIAEARSTTSKENLSEREKYNTWLNNRALSLTNLAGGTRETFAADKRIAIICVARGHDLNALATTIDDLAAHCWGNWQLIILADIPPPPELAEIDCIHWFSAENTNPEILQTTIADLGSEWIVEAPPGTRFDELLFSTLFQVDRSKILAVFADNDYYDDNNQRHGPRFKPGVNPTALMSADLAGPLCTARDAWLALPPRSNSPAPWLNTLWAISRIHGWKAIQHLPHVYFSLPEAIRCPPPELIAALEQELANHDQPYQLQPINSACWSIIRPLPSPQPSVLVLIQSDGDIGMIERCLESIINKTDYPCYRLGFLVAFSDRIEPDPDRDIWLSNYQRQNPYTSIFVQKNDEIYSDFVNSAVANAGTDFVLFISDALVPLHESWLEELVRACIPSDIVGASPRLIQAQTGHIESCGYILGLQGWRGSAYFREPRKPITNDFDWIDTSRDISTLTTACAIVRTKSFHDAGGLDSGFISSAGSGGGFTFALADLSLRFIERGARLIYVPRANLGGSAEPTPPRCSQLEDLMHRSVADYECLQSFKTRWWPKYASDPYWNRNLSLAENYPKIETEYLADWFHPNEINQRESSPVPKILAHVIDNAQADFRITDALWHLKQQGRVSTCVWEQRINRAARFHTASEITRLSPDVHLVQNYVNNLCLDALDSWYNMPQRPFTVFVLDDVITAIDPSSPFYKNFSPDTRSCLSHALTRCDRMVVSTDFLADYYRNFIKDIRVVPNRLEMGKWLTLTSQKRLGNKVRIGWAGGTTHHRDLMLLKEVIEQTRNEADWIFFGMCPPEISPLVTESHPFIPYAQYPAFLANLGLDLAVAPLAETLFNRGKSNLRLLELGILGIPVVCTDIEPYHKSPACKVKNTVGQWVSALRERIHDADAREKEGRTMREWVLQNYLLENHLDEWLDAHTPD